VSPPVNKYRIGGTKEKRKVKKEEVKNAANLHHEQPPKKKKKEAKDRTRQKGSLRTLREGGERKWEQ